MPTSIQNHEFTRANCGFLIDSLIRILNKIGLGQEVDFLVYGSYFEKWHDGLSDLDGILYFSKLPPLHLSLRGKIKSFQSEIVGLFEEYPRLKLSNCFADVFILDSFHGSDGRFVVYDTEWIKMFWVYSAYQIMHGSMFIDKLNAVSLRNQNEFELAMGLHKLRNYLFFEIPLPPADMSLSRAKDVLKFFKVLPRVTTILLNKPMAKSLRELVVIDRFADIDFTSYFELWNKTSDSNIMARYLNEWHEPGNDAFLSCLECFETVLAILVKSAPMKSHY